MIEKNPQERLGFQGELEPVFGRACEYFDLGNFQSFQAMPVGYEDYNAHVATTQGNFFIKTFAEFRTASDIARYESIMGMVAKSIINHPALHRSRAGSLAYRDEISGLEMVAMDFIPGKTFYDDGKRVATDIELKKVMEQAVYIHSLKHKPAFLYDSWAIPNIRETYDDVTQFLDAGELAIVNRIIDELEAVDTKSLPHCFVHGDLTKSNLLNGEDGKIYVLDFSVANWYPRIQELAVVVGNLLADTKAQNDFLGTLEKVVTYYSQAGGKLTTLEAAILPIYARAAHAAEFLGATREKFINHNDTPETDYWLSIGRLGLELAYS